MMAYRGTTHPAPVLPPFIILQEARKAAREGEILVKQGDTDRAVEVLIRSFWHFFHLPFVQHDDEVSQVLLNLSTVLLNEDWWPSEQRASDLLSMAARSHQYGQQKRIQGRLHLALHLFQTVYIILTRRYFKFHFATVSDVLRQLTILYQQNALETCECTGQGKVTRKIAYKTAVTANSRADIPEASHMVMHKLHFVNTVFNRLPLWECKDDLLQNLQSLLKLYQAQPRLICTCSELSIEAPDPVWTELLKKLSDQNNWIAIRHLLGESPPPRNALSGAAKGQCATEVNIQGLLKTLSDEDLASWGLDFAVTLLKRGASVDTVWTKDGSKPIYVALQYGLRMFLKCPQRESRDEKNERKQRVNSAGDSPLHLVAKSGMADMPVGVKALTLLLDHGARRDIPDRYGRLAVEYLNPTDQVYDLLLQTEPEPRKKDHCDLCRSRLYSAKELHRRGRFSMATEALCKILSNSSHSSARHDNLYKEAKETLSLLLEKLPPSDIQKCVTHLYQNAVQGVVYEMVRTNQWQKAANLIRMWRQENPKSRTIAEALYINEVIESDSLPTRSLIKTEVIQVLLDNGARLKPSHREVDEPIRVAVRNGEFRVIPVLISHGLSPKNIQQKTGDLPLHVALKIALEWDKGYFELFEKLLELSVQGGPDYRYINPSSVDKHGNTLLDVVDKYKTSWHTERAVQLIRDWIQKGDDQHVMEHKSNSSRGTTFPAAQSKVVKASQSAAGKLNVSSPPETVIVEFINSYRPDWTEKDLTRCGAEKKSSNFDYEINSENTLVLPGVRKSKDGIAKMNDKKAKDQQKLKTDFEFDSRVFDDLAWEVECKTDVWKTLHNRKVPVDLKKKAIGTIKQLGDGEWTDSLSKYVRYVPASLKLFEAKISEDARILWELAISLSSRFSDGHEAFFSEIIRVWDIVLDHDKLSHRIRQVTKSHTKGKTCLRRLALLSLPAWRPSARDNTRQRLPQRFRKAAEVECGELALSPPANPDDKQYSVLKFHAFSSDVVRHILEQTDAKIDFPFKVTAEEQYIISVGQESPLLLLGRSGTGKTTCCLYRLWHFYKVYWSSALYDEPLIPRRRPQEASGRGSAPTPTVYRKADFKNSGSDTGYAKQPSTDETLGHLQQLFVTKNEILLQEVRKKFNELRNGCDLSRPESRPNSPVPNKLQDIPIDQYPLFVTSSKLLLMLDASLPGTPFFDKSETDVTLLHNADSSLAQLLEARPGSVASSGKSSKPMVTYDIFVEQLWPKIVGKSKFHPSLVWTEIFTFIKGSFLSLLSERGYLTLEEYQQVGRKCAPSFTDCRHDIYKLFTNYEKERKRKGLSDECDLLHNIHSRLKENAFDWQVDEVYVDETQDFTPAELDLLIRLCKNRNRMFLSGDTAQAIMRGISFRFADLKSLFFHTSDVEVPKQLFQLTDNYRSHQGILSLASSIVDLMVDFFPNSLDRLGRDQGVFAGPLPILFEFCNSKDLVLLLKDNRQLTSDIEFGAHQAIVVVNEAARLAIPEELRTGLVLTIEESKGLEFDDVLLYNFFKDSYAGEEWRIVTGYLHKLSNAGDEPLSTRRKTTAESVELDKDVLRMSSCRPLAFDEVRHRILCSEFKLLYTAITRARVNLWIYDEDEKSRAPMFDYFKARCLVRTITSGQEEADYDQILFAQTSSSADWSRRGDQLMERHSYDMAIKCYQKAGDEAKEHVAMAHAGARRARGLDANPSKMREEYLTAAKLYLVNCGMVVKAAECLVAAKKTLLAARLYGKIGQVEKAGELFELCGHPYDECWHLESQGLYNKAVQVLCDKKNFDMAIDVLERYDDKIKGYVSQGLGTPQTMLENKPVYSREELSQKAGRIHSENKRNQSARKKADVNRLLEQGLITEAVKLLKESGDYHYAANVLMVEGEFEEAMDICKLIGDNDLVRECEWASSKKKIFQAELTNTPAVDDGSVAERLGRLLDYFDGAKDFSEACEARLLLGQITEDVDGIEKARLKFGCLGSESNEAGQVECSKAKLKLISLRHSSKACYKFASQDLACLLQTLRISHNPSDDTEESKAKLYLKYYGLEDDEDGTVMYQPKQSPKCLSFLTRHSQEFTVKISSYLAQERFQRYLLSLAYEWVNVIRTTLQGIQVWSSQCPEFTEGRPCNRGHACKQLHQAYTKETFLECFYCLLTIVHIEAILMKAYHYMKDDDIKVQLGQLLSWESGAAFSNLVCFLLKSGMHWKLFSADTHLVDRVFIDLCQRDLNEGLLLWQSWYSEGGIRTSYRLTEQSLSGLVALSEMEKMNLSRVYNRSPSMAPFFTASTNQEKKDTLLSNFSKFSEAVHKVYHSVSGTAEILDAYAEFLKSMSDPTGLQLTEQLLFFMEFNLMVIFCLGAKHVKLPFISPSRYLSVVRFVDRCFAGRKSLRYIVAFSKAMNIDSNLNNTMDILTNILLGKKQGSGQRSNGLLWKLFMGSDIDACVAERCYLMSLTLLSNISLLVPKRYENELLSAVHEVCSRLQEVKWPQRLVSALQGTFRCSGQRDIVAILITILREQNNEDLLFCQ